MHCPLYDAGRCRSCQWLERLLTQQLASKMADLETLLADSPVATWLAPVSGPQAGFRNKAKWWSAAALNARRWGCCTAMAVRKT